MNSHRPAAFISHPVFLEPGFGAHHPLSTGRQRAVVDILRALDWLRPADIVDAPAVDVATLATFHTPDYLAALQRVAEMGVASADDRVRFGLGTMECPVFPGLWERVRHNVGGAIKAAELALAGIVAFHPAGGTHHGKAGRASGFCYSNDPVFAIRALRDGGLRRVAYIDLDAHHGDGVEIAMRDDPGVGFFSIHEAGRWPGTGPTAQSTDGRIVNHAVAAGIGDAGYCGLVADALYPWLGAFRPEGLIVCLGADALAGDPLSRMGLSNRTLWGVVERCVATVPHAVILGGGGYNPWTTARLWAGMWGHLTGRAVDAPLPPAAAAILRALSSDLVDDDDVLPIWTTTLAD